MKNTHIAALLIIGVLIAYIATTASSYSTYETFATAYSNSDKQFQVVGQLVKDKEMHYDPEKDPNYFSFYMYDNNNETRKVIYTGSKPQDFEKSEQIVLTGQMKGENFHASKILLKCPSKYIEDKLNDEGLYEVEKEVKPTL